MGWLEFGHLGWNAISRLTQYISSAYQLTGFADLITPCVGHPPAHNNTGSGLTLYQFQDFLFSLSLSLFKLIKHQSETDFQNILSQCKFNSLCVSPYPTPMAKLSRSLLQPFAGKLQVEYLKDAWGLRQRYQLLKTPTKGNLKVFLGLNVQHWK